MFRITTSPAAYSNSTTRPAVITHRPSCSCLRRSRGSGMPSRIAATAADMPLSYQSFKKYAQESPGKTACHRPMAVLSPEIWGRLSERLAPAPAVAALPPPLQPAHRHLVQAPPQVTRAGQHILMHPPGARPAVRAHRRARVIGDSPHRHRAVGLRLGPDDLQALHAEQHGGR